MIQFKLDSNTAYLIGVYFSDGCINLTQDNCYRFCLSVTDKGFAESVAITLQKLLGRKVTISEQQRGTRKLLYNVFVRCDELCRWVLLATKNGSSLPDETWEALPIVKHKLITGFIDGDGYISKSKQKHFDTYRHQIGYCSTDTDLLAQYNKLLTSLGVSVWPKPLICKGGFAGSIKPVVHYRFNVASFIRAGCRFSIKRKSDRLDECINLLPQRLNATHLRRLSGYSNQINNIRKPSA